MQWDTLWNFLLGPCHGITESCYSREYIDMVKALEACCNRNADAAEIMYEERLPRWHILMIKSSRVEQQLPNVRHLNQRHGMGGHPLNMLWQEDE